MPDIQKGNLAFLVKSVVKADDSAENEDIIIEGFANTTAEDRSSDIIPLSAWQKPTALDNYKKNPIVLAYHDHKLPIGVVESLEPSEEGLYVKARISNTVPAVFTAIQKGILKAFSIGFRLHDYVYDQTTDVFVLTEIEMTELSVVSVPCNQDSIFSVSKSLEDREQLKKKLSETPVAAKAEESEIIKLARLFGCVKENV